MKRLIPLWITALGGFVLIVAYFIPSTQGWGEVAAIWFDILAAIAFILGGGNLLKIHLKGVSDRKKGWGYSLITVVAFIGMLYIGLVKWGSPPAPNQEYYGETFVSLPMSDLPASLTFSVPGSFPHKVSGELPHHSVRSQIEEEDGRIVFHGWMRRGQRAALENYADHLDWQCAVQRLYEAAQPQGLLKGRAAYYASHGALSFRGHMTDGQQAALLALGNSPEWTAAVNELHARAAEKTSVAAAVRPPYFDSDGPFPDITYDASAKQLEVTGPLTPDQRNTLADLFPRVRPLDAAGRATFVAALEAEGPLHPAQIAALDTILAGSSWEVADLRVIVDDAGKAKPEPRTPCALYADEQAGLTDYPLTEVTGRDQTLDTAQVALLGQYAKDVSMSSERLVTRLAAAGPLNDAQKTALRGYLSALPTIGERNRMLFEAMMKAKDEDGHRLGLTAGQRDLLLEDYRHQVEWRASVGNLYIASHRVKFPWSGEYRAQGNPFWWMYEYAFKPLQATIFAMLAFYVASAAFRAFRAKNVEAILLLGTAFIILLGRTFAGVFLTTWMPDFLSGLKIENLTVTIMTVFNTAGNRAIMIGIALGIASTSLKVLLGVDRSYLGSGDE